MVANAYPSLTPEDYLAWEERQIDKYEFIDGQILAMTGGTLSHNDIAFNIASLLRVALRPQGGKVQIADAKVQVGEKGPYFYPDVVVSCDERDKKAVRFLNYPCLIVEVLSPGTEAYDRGDKFKFYRQIRTLREYVLVLCTGQKIGVGLAKLTRKGFHRKLRHNSLKPYEPD
ncbi:MAG: hypothetical protein N5P05_002314 [Chroococcopsis gigantea SAG 12.99]|jgi:Uma2 family endonuclease|nr:Uma2 family endonuclease [Chlorogloea purpurea SAG 13.99]MDV3000708.1 hypothetical protein [Chroococcopsis gigantea SAG 12.99]